MPDHHAKQASQVIRLVVIGLHKCGKTRFIKTISQYTEWQAHPKRSWFFGRVRVDQSLILHLLEPPIAPRFDYLWLRDLVGRIKADGYIALVDSTKPQTFAEFVSIIYTVRGYHPDTPIVVACNKQDKRWAWDIDDIQLGLGLRDFSVLPCIAHQHNAVRDVVIAVLSMLLA